MLTVALPVRTKISVAFQRNRVNAVISTAGAFGLLSGIRCDVRIGFRQHNRSALTVIAVMVITKTVAVIRFD